MYNYEFAQSKLYPLFHYIHGSEELKHITTNHLIRKYMNRRKLLKLRLDLSY